MAITINEEHSTADYLEGADRSNIIEVIFNGNLGTYATDGVAVDKDDFGANTAAKATTLVHMTIEPSDDYTHAFTFDKSNGKIKAWVQDTGAEAAGGDLSGKTFRGRAFFTRG